MENVILDALNSVQGGATSENDSAGLNLEFGGSIIMKRGAFQEKYYFYARLYETKHKGVIGIDDWDVNDRTNAQIGSLPISNLDSFKRKVDEWGLNSISRKLDFSNDEIKKGIAECMLQDSQLKLLYGKKFKVWDVLSEKEQKLLELQYVVENFDTNENHLQKEVAKYYKLNAIEPTLDDFKNKLAELAI